MDKIIVNVFSPALGTNYDFFIPVQSQMYEVCNLIGKSFSGLSEGRFKADEKTVICFKNTGDILNPSMTIAELGLRNGEKLMII